MVNVPLSDAVEEADKQKDGVGGGAERRMATRERQTAAKGGRRAGSGQAVPGTSTTSGHAGG
jgi:hypothetical protein